MGSAESKAIFTQIITDIGLAALQIALKALMAASPMAQDPATVLQDYQLSSALNALMASNIVDTATQDDVNQFGVNFNYVWNGQRSVPPNYTGGPIIAPKDFVFFSPEVPALNDMQTYIGNLLQPMTQAGYDTDTISLDVSAKMNEIYAAAGGVWTYFNATYTSTKVDKTCEVDMELFTCNISDNNGHKLTFCAVSACVYDAESLFSLRQQKADPEKYRNALEKAKCYIWTPDGEFLPISNKAAGYLKEAAPDVNTVVVYGTYDVDGQLFGGIAGSAKDTRTNWKQLWMSHTGLPWGMCSVDTCTVSANVGGHTFFQGSPGDWFITPICYGHNSRTYDGDDTMRARRGTETIRINPVALLTPPYPCEPLTGVAKEIAEGAMKGAKKSAQAL